MLNRFLNLIYKKKCLICNCNLNNSACSKLVDNLCKTCAKDVDKLSGFAHRIYKGIPIYSAYSYDKTIKNLIRKLKFSHKKQACLPLSQYLFQYFEGIENIENSIIIYPSSYFTKTFERGFDHMALIAREFSKISNIKYLKNAIQKVKHTTPQYKAKNRFKNIEGAYRVNRKYIDELKTKNVILIDDITTTSATVEEIVNILLKNEIKNVMVLTISKAV